MQETFSDLILGTFGRSFWIFDDVEVLRELYRNKTLVTRDFELMDSPDAHLTSFRSFDGIRFIAQGEFVGDNKPRSAQINYWVKPKEDSEDVIPAKKEKDTTIKKGKKIKVMIVDSQGYTIRRFKTEALEGLNKIRWGLNRDGVRYPSRKLSKKEDDLPGGLRVLLGKYKVVATYKGTRDSVMINVKMDPRIDVMTQQLDAIKEVYDAHNEKVAEASDALKRVQEARESLGLVVKILEVHKDTTLKEIKKEADELKKEMDRLEELYMMPEGLKGIQRNPKTLNGLLGTASYYIGSSWEKPGDNAMRAVKEAWDKTDEAVGEIDNFFSKKWKPFKTRFEALGLTPFGKE